MKLRKKTGKGLVAGGTPRVNLLPRQEVESRARGGLWRRWKIAFGAAFVLVAIEGAVGVSWTSWASDKLAAEAQISEQLQSQLAGYSQVIYLRGHLVKLERLRAQAGSNDQDWGPLITEIKAVLPEGVRLIGFKLVPGAAPVPGTDASAQVGLKGDLTFSARATSAQSETIMRLRTLHGFIEVDAGGLSSDGSAGGLTFVTTFSADQTRYSGRFVQSGGE